MKHKNLLLGALLVVLVLTASIGSAWAYFTTYAVAKGGYPVHLGDRTEITETFSNWTKKVTITSEADSEPVYIRAIAYCGSEYDLVYSDASGKWSPGADGYYYYSDIVPGGGSTTELEIRIDNVPEDVTDGDSFNVVVVYESTPVCYQADGTPYADWDQVLDTGTAEGGES